MILDFEDNLLAAITAYETAVIGEEDPFLTTDLFTRDAGVVDALEWSYGYLDDLSEARDHIPGENRVYDGARAYNATYKIQYPYRAWQQAVPNIEHDRSGRVAAAAAQAGAAALRTPDQKIWAKFTANDRNGPDGVPLFSASHPHGPAGATQDNTTSSALTHATYRAARAVMETFQKENSEYYGAAPNILVVDPTRRNLAQEIMSTDRVVYFDANASEATSSVVGAVRYDNVAKGEVAVMVTPRIGTSAWYLIDNTGAEQCWVKKQSPMVPNSPNPDHESWKQKNLAQWHSQGQLIQGPGAWWRCYRGGV